MALKSPEAFIESLRDDRRIHMNGKWIADVTSAPRLKEAARHSALTYQMGQDPDLKKHVVSTCPETGEEIAAFYRMPQTAGDLLARCDAIYQVSRYGGGFIPFVKEIGTDAIFSLRMIAPQVDRKFGTNYAQRVKAYHHYAQANDLALAGAVTDPKGDRNKKPHEQENPEVFLRVVEKREDGIVVEGAKCHITSSPVSNELVVLPTRNLGAEDSEYAVAFAIPANAPGITMIPMHEHHCNEPVDRPLSTHHPIVHAMILFDHVFIPWERVFLCGEWEFSGSLVLSFASWHRFTGLCYKGPVAELFLGSAALMADFNGVAKTSNVRNKLQELAMYIESIGVYSRMACYEHQTVEGIAMPNSLHCNVGKYLFAENYHTMIKYVQEITGGIGGTCPSFADYQSPELHEKLDRYLCGRADIPTEARIRVIKLVRDLTASCDAGGHMFGTIHGEGTLEAQRMMVLRDFDMRPAITLARRAAGLDE